MTSFTDCIKNAVADGKLSADRGAQAEKAFDAALEDQIAKGFSEDAARNSAAMEATTLIVGKNRVKRWAKVNELRKAHKLHTDITQAKDIPRALKQIMDLQETIIDRTTGLAMRNLGDFLEKYRPKAAGLLHPTQGLDDIIRAGHGESVSDPVAASFANAIRDMNDWLIKRANLEGASIPFGKKNRMVQMHDRIKVKQIEGGMTTWVNDHLNTLDWDEMRYQGEEVPVAQRRAVLEKTYNRIITNGHSEDVAGQAGLNLAQRLSHQRFLHYKDADSYMAMQEKYGSGNLFQQVISSVDSMARDIAQLETLGPNPSAMKAYVERLSKLEASKRLIDNPATKKDPLNQVETALHKFNERFRLHTNAVLNGEGNLMATSLATARPLVNATMLGSVFISSLGDLTLMKQARLFHKLPIMGTTRAYMKAFTGSKADRINLVESGFKMESALSMAHSYSRYFGPMDGAKWAQRLTDIQYRATFATLHNHSAKAAHFTDMENTFADFADVEYGDLPWIKLAKASEITQEDWNLFRGMGIDEADGVRRLRAVNLIDQQGTPTQMERNSRVADKFLNLIYETSKMAVPMSESSVQVALGATTPATTALGQLSRFGSQLKAFPTTLMMRHMGDIASTGSRTDKLKNTAVFFTLLTAGGAFITQAKAVSQGKEPYDMWSTDPDILLDFWGRAMINGGSLGLFGDLIMDSYGNGIADTVMGPMAGFFDTVKNVGHAGKDDLYNAATGKNEKVKSGKAAVKAALQYSPKPWQVRLLLDRTIRDQVLEDVDPKGYARLLKRQRDRETEFNQGTWWGVGDDPTAPDLTNLVGGE